MKTGITTIYTNIQVTKEHPKGLEASWMSKHFNADFIGKRARTNQDVVNFVDINELSYINSYDHIILQLDPMNFFGGELRPDTYAKVKKLCAFKGKFSVMATDPRIKPRNAAEVIQRKFGGISDMEVRNFEQLLLNANYLFPGDDIHKFWPNCEYPRVTTKIDMFTGIFKETVPIRQWSIYPKTYDVVYYGFKRGDFRERMLQKFTPNTTKNLLIGYKTEKVHADFEKKIKHKLLMDKLDQCKVSLLLYDKEHEDNVVTFRFYETLASNCLLAIPIEFDPQMKLIKHPRLRELLYIRDYMDVELLTLSYNKQLVELQKQELKRIYENGLY